MSRPGHDAGHDRSVEDRLSAALRPDADHEPGLDSGSLGALARRGAGRIRRRRSATATALASGTLVAAVLLAVPALRPNASDSVPAAPPSASAAPSVQPSDQPSDQPSGDLATSPDQPLARTADGNLRVPEEVAVDATALPEGIGVPLSATDYPAGAFLQELVPACGEASGEGSSGQPGGDFLGSRTWTHPSESTATSQTSAEARADLFAPGAAETALQVLRERATACEEAGLGLVVDRTARSKEIPSDGYLMVTGTTPGVEGSPEVGVPPISSALVVVRVGDVLVRGYVTRSGDVTTRSDVDLYLAAEQLAAGYADGVRDSGTAGRLAASR